MEEQDAHEMLHVIMTTLEEEIPSKGNNNKPSHASLLDISNLGRDDDSDDVDDEEDSDGDSSYYGNPNRNRFSLQRGMSLPPESRTRDNTSMTRGTRDTHSTQCAAVITITGSQLSNAALHPCQPSKLLSMDTCHGNSPSRARPPPTTWNSASSSLLLRLLTPPFLPQLVAFLSLALDHFQ